MSEHTVDGHQYELEMHTVHYPEAPQAGFIASAVGIFFSVNDYTADVTPQEEAIIDNFFEQMQWNVTDSSPLADLVSYGDLMTMVDTRDRWVYNGSVTTPPCAHSVYWNVLRTVYPVKQKYVDGFKNQLARGKDGLGTSGNWRVQIPVDTHNLRIIGSGYMGKGG